MEYREYLMNEGLASSTIKGLLGTLNRFREWLDKQGIEEVELVYQDLLAFIRYSEGLEKSIGYINKELRGILKYYRYLGVELPTYDTLKVKGEQRKIVHDVLRMEVLEELYKSYPTDSPVRLRNKVILGLMIYGGIRTAELAAMQVEHINLDDCKVYVPSVARSNSRELILHSKQVLPLVQYINQGRNELLLEANKESGRLIVSSGSSHSIHNLLSKLLQHLEGVNSFEQIRSSVIVFWLNNGKNLNEVKYLAGHKHIDSTERYMMADLNELKDELERFHVY